MAEVEPEPLPLIACAMPFGISFPPLFAALRALLGQLAGRADLTESAYALEAVMQELFFISGPLLVAVLVAAASPQVALAVAAVMTSVGTLAFAALPASREWRAEERQGRRRIGALASPGLRTLLAVSGAFGLAFGTLEVTMPAFADEHGSRGGRRRAARGRRARQHGGRALVRRAELGGRPIHPAGAVLDPVRDRAGAARAGRLDAA